MLPPGVGEPFGLGVVGHEREFVGVDFDGYALHWNAPKCLIAMRAMKANHTRDAIIAPSNTGCLGTPSFPISNRGRRHISKRRNNP